VHPLSGEEKEAHVRRVFAAIARVYDPMNRVLTFGLWGSWQSRLIRLVAPRPGERWLDVASGTADLAIRIGRLVGPGGEVVGVDISREMLAVGREKVARAGLQDRVVLQEANALALPFADGSFDGAVVGFGLRNMSDVAAALAEVRRVLRPGGRFASLEVSHPEHPLVAFAFHLYFDHVVPCLGVLAGTGRTPYAWLPESLRHFPGRGELEVLLRRAGFDAVRSFPLTLGVAAIHLGVRGDP
jgi:demethylmenaquinone methyltransferase/2-methoxy-6-polyprenyl-1,4-benzoquinol methylase